MKGNDMFANILICALTSFIGFYIGIVITNRIWRNTAGITPPILMSKGELYVITKFEG